MQTLKNKSDQKIQNRITTPNDIFTEKMLQVPLNVFITPRVNYLYLLVAQIITRWSLTSRTYYICSPLGDLRFALVTDTSLCRFVHLQNVLFRLHSL